MDRTADRQLSFNFISIKRLSTCLPPLILCLAVLTRLPYLLFPPFPCAPLAERFRVVDPSVIAALALLLVLTARWKPEKFNHDVCSLVLFPGALIVVFTVCLVHFFLFTNYAFSEFSFNLVWFALPLAVFLRGAEFKRLVVPFFAVFWIFNAIYAGQDLWRMGEEIGVPANRNWHGSFVIATTPFFIHFIHGLLNRRGLSLKTSALILTVPLLFSLVVLYRCQSRGANLGLAVTALVFSLAHLRSKGSLSASGLRKLCLFGSVGGFVVFAAAFLLYGDLIADMIMRDVRIPLWGGAVSLFARHPVLGVGAAGYESHYTYHIPLAKFLRSWYYTERSDHPHNFFLYMAGSLGAIGLVATLFLWFYPIYDCVKRFKRLDIAAKLALFGFMVFTVHSLFDIVMSVWPTVYLALILLGLLWHETFTPNRSSSLPAERISVPPASSTAFSAFAKSLAAISVFTLLCFTVFLAHRVATGSQAERRAVLYYENGHFAAALPEYDKAATSNAAPIFTYQAGMFSLLYMRDYRLALKYFTRLHSLPDKIIVHSNAHIAECLIHLGRRREALSYLYDELKVYPVSIIALHNVLKLEKALGLEAEAEKTALRLLEALKFKGLTVDDIELILKHPKLDGRFNLIDSYRNLSDETGSARRRAHSQNVKKTEL